MIRSRPVASRPCERAGDGTTGLGGSPPQRLTMELALLGRPGVLGPAAARGWQDGRPSARRLHAVADSTRPGHRGHFAAGDQLQRIVGEHGPAERVSRTAEFMDVAASALSRLRFFGGVGCRLDIWFHDGVLPRIRSAGLGPATHLLGWISQ